MAEPKGGKGGHLPPWLLKFSNISSLKQLLIDMEEKKKKKKRTSTWLKVTLTQEKERKKKFASTKPCFCLVLSETCFYFNIFIYIIIYTTFTIYNTFHSILSLNDARDITNFTTYVLQIIMSPITENNFKHIFIIFFK